MKNGIEMVAEERQRQIDKEGWTPEHDAEHNQGTLALAGACYALGYAGLWSSEHLSWREEYAQASKALWPFDEEWWKPTPGEPMRQLVKAAALIVAEIDKLQRLNSLT